MFLICSGSFWPPWLQLCVFWRRSFSPLASSQRSFLTVHVSMCKSSCGSEPEAIPLTSGCDTSSAAVRTWRSTLFQQRRMLLLRDRPRPLCPGPLQHITWFGLNRTWKPGFIQHLADVIQLWSSSQSPGLSPAWCNISFPPPTIFIVIFSRPQPSSSVSVCVSMWTMVIIYNIVTPVFSSGM